MLKNQKRAAHKPQHAGKHHVKHKLHKKRPLQNGFSAATTATTTMTTTTTTTPHTQQHAGLASRSPQSDKNQLLQQPDDVLVIDPSLIFGQQAYMHKSTTGMSVARYYTNANAEKPREQWDYENHRLKYHDLSDYDCLTKLGRGKYSEVFCGYKNSLEMPVVIKVLKPVKKKKIRREVLALQNLRGHPYITQLIDVLKDPTHRTTVLIYKLAMGDDHKEVFATLTDPECRVYMYQLLKALDFAHSRGVMHRDIKPQNIVIDRENRVARVIDWGLAEFYHPNTEYNVRVASRFFKGPELLINMKDYDYSLDMWSLGATFAGMIFGVHPFFAGANDNLQMISTIARVTGSKEWYDYIEKYKIPIGQQEQELIGKYSKKSFTQFINENNAHTARADAIDLLSKLLVVDHNERLSAKEAMAHPYFDKVRAQVDKQCEILTQELNKELERLDAHNETATQNMMDDDNDDNLF